MNLSALNLNEVGVNQIARIEEDDIAEFTATTSGLSGLVDLNTGGGMPTFAKTLTGSFPTPVDSNGRSTATTTSFDSTFMS